MEGENTNRNIDTIIETRNLAKRWVAYNDWTTKIHALAWDRIDDQLLIWKFKKQSSLKIETSEPVTHFH